ncbi:MAG TPA: glutaminyl-peptide cyclotransferase [Jiangellales bacterium]|nr:glutaminyl-peptide cyclotransferase [Jiangellales bacterium]
MRRGLVVAVAAGVLAAGAGVVAWTAMGGSEDGSCPSATLPEAPSATGGLAAAPSAADAEAAGPTPYEVEVLARYPHDPAAFTQGLLVRDGVVYEGTGLYGESEARAVDLASGEVLASEPLPDEVFGEGLALHDDRLYQLSWQQQEGWTRDPCSLEVLDTFRYEGEGWGLASDGEVLWRSDGTSTLTAHDPETFAVVRTVEVLDRGVPVESLNELEVVGDEVLANVWLTDGVVRIDPATGVVTGWIDASVLTEEVSPEGGDDVLNGIAATSDGERVWLTGKRWPTVFEVRVTPGGELPPPGGG